MFRIKKVLFAALAALLLLLPTFAAAEGEDIIPQEDIKADATNYKTEAVGYGTFTKVESTQGLAYFPSITSVIYDGLKAVYVEALAQFGDYVEAGQELVKIEVEKDEARIRELELKLERTRSSYEISLRDKQREISNMNLDRNKLSDAYAIQKANLNIEAKEVELARYIYTTERDISKQEEEIQKLNDQSAVTYITAPVAGKVTNQKYYAVGDPVNPGDVLFRITDTSVFYVAAESSNFHYGTDVTVTAGIRGKEYEIPGKVVVCTADIKGSVKTRVIMRVEAPEEIRAMLTKNSEINFAAVRLSVSGETNRVDNVLLMPMSAKENSGQETYTNILDVNNQVHHRPIRVAFTNRDFAWILSGLSEGDVVILN